MPSRLFRTMRRPKPSSPGSRVVGSTWALSIAAVSWGLINFGLLLWMPAHLVERGYSMAVSSRLLSSSALIAIPTVFVAALAYSRWSSKGALMASIAIAGAGLVGLMRLELVPVGGADPVWPIALLIVGINGIIAMLLPYAAENYPLAIRGARHRLDRGVHEGAAGSSRSCSACSASCRRCSRRRCWSSCRSRCRCP